MGSAAALRFIQGGWEIGMPQINFPSSSIEIGIEILKILDASLWPL